MPVDRRGARHGNTLERQGARKARKEPLSAARIVQAALDLVAAEGFEALTMRRVAAALDTGPASLYAHVVNKADLDELLIGYLCSQIDLPEPDPDTWREQILDVAAQMRDLYLEYPGISQAALAVVPTNLETLRISEGLLAVLLAGRVAPQTAAWAVDVLSLYVSAYCLEMSRWVRQMEHERGSWVLTQEALMARFVALPESEFPLTKRYASQLTAGDGHDRFDFAMRTMLDGLGGRVRRRSSRARNA